MIQPSLEQLMQQVDSRYTLVIVAARRARQIMEGSKRRVDGKSDKPVTVALEEIAAGKVRYERPAPPSR